MVYFIGFFVISILNLKICEINFHGIPLRRGLCHCLCESHEHA